jgi:ankyrin repeat protein
MAAAGQGVSIRDRRDYSLEAQEPAIRTLEFLLAAGAEVNARIEDVSGQTARIARPSTLSERGGQTALYGAIKFAWVDVVKWLIDHGAEVDIQDDMGVTPLDAAEGRIGGRDNIVSEEVAELLKNALEQGA